MTPAARVQAAITLLDLILSGESAEKTLTRWGRQNRYAGSKDRAAIRDWVYDALRCRRSYAACGGAETGRALLIAALRRQNLDPQDYFNAQGYAPSLLAAEEGKAKAHISAAEQADLPDWLWPIWQQDLGEDAAPVAENLRARAPVFLRVNLALATRDAAAEALRKEKIFTAQHAFVETALQVLEGARKIKTSRAYEAGLVELQDASSQASITVLPRETSGPVLDYCAGGGGKTLALAAWLKQPIFAFDSAGERMRDLPIRAARAQAEVVLLDQPPFADGPAQNLVFCDMPCSGSGVWRRDPSGKWTLTAARLRDLQNLQSEILAQASALVASGGLLLYATCSVLKRENSDQIESFIAGNPSWSCLNSTQFLPSNQGDGFYYAVLKKD